MTSQPSGENRKPPIPGIPWPEEQSSQLTTEVLGLCNGHLSLAFLVHLPEDGIGLSDIGAFHRPSHFSTCDYQTCSYWKDTAFDFSCQNGIELCFIAAEEKCRSKCHDEILN